MDILWNVRHTILFEYHKSIIIQIFKYSNLGSDCLGHTCLLNVSALFTTHVFLCCESLRVISTSLGSITSTKWCIIQIFRALHPQCNRRRIIVRRDRIVSLGGRAGSHIIWLPGLWAKPVAHPKGLLYLCRVNTRSGWVGEVNSRGTRDNGARSKAEGAQPEGRKSKERRPTVTGVCCSFAYEKSHTTSSCDSIKIGSANK